MTGYKTPGHFGHDSTQMNGNFLTRMDAIVILSTHIVSDVEHIADRILMMKDGSIVFDGQAADIQGDLETFYLKTFGGEDE